MWDLHRLRLLRELQVRGTIAEVARVLNFSPSTVSHQLNRLQAEVGEPLLVPDGRRVALTPHAEVLARHAEQVMELAERTRIALAELEPGPEVVRVASLESVASALLPRVLADLARTAPGVRLDVAVVPPEDGLAELAARTFDLAFAEQYPGHTRPHQEGIDRTLLGLDPIRLAVAGSDAAATLGDVRDRPWVMEPAGTASRSWALQQCRAAGFEPQVRFHAAGLDTHIRLIASGEAVGFLPDLALRHGPAEVGLRDLPGGPRREIFISTRSAGSESAPLRAVREAFGAAWRHDSSR